MGKKTLNMNPNSKSEENIKPTMKRNSALCTVLIHFSSTVKPWTCSTFAKIAYKVQYLTR